MRHVLPLKGPSSSYELLPVHAGTFKCDENEIMCKPQPSSAPLIILGMPPCACSRSLADDDTGSSCRAVGDTEEMRSPECCTGPVALSNATACTYVRGLVDTFGWRFTLLMTVMYMGVKG